VNREFVRKLGEKPLANVQRHWLLYEPFPFVYTQITKKVKKSSFWTKKNFAENHFCTKIAFSRTFP